MNTKILLALATIPALPALAAGATLCVEPAGAGGCHTTIQAAVDAAAAADLVLVRPGLYFEGVVIPAGKDGLQIAGTDRERVVIDASPYADRGFAGADVAFHVFAPDVGVRNLSLRNGTVGFAVQASRVVLSNLHVRGTISAVSIGTFAEDVVVEGCDIHDVSSVVGSAGPRTIVRNNRIRNVGLGMTLDIFSADGAQAIGNRLETGSIGLLLDADQVVARGNVVKGFGGDSVSVFGNNPIVEDNVVADSAFGMFVFCIDEEVPGGNEPPECVSASISRNRVSGTSFNGVALQAKAVGTVVRDNVLEDSGQGFVAVALTDSAITFERNRAARIGRDLDADCFDVFAGDVNGNTASRCSQAGFHTRAVSVRDNLAFDNAGDGFTVDGDVGPNLVVTSGVEVLGNVSRGNAAQGIAILRSPFTGPFGIRVDGNTALGNRTDFCDEGEGTVLGANTFGTIGPCSVRH